MRFSTILLLTLALAVAGCTGGAVEVARSTAPPVDPSPSIAGDTAPDSVSAQLYEVVEVDFAGPVQTPQDTPARDISLSATFAHDSGETVTIPGFWDGDGQGGDSGDVFRIRFTPTQPGTWTMTEVTSNAEELDGQRRGLVIDARGEPASPGFWLVDDDSAERRWFRRSDGSHPFWYGNTMYHVLSRHGEQPSTPETIARDAAASARYFGKLRFHVAEGNNPHPDADPFFAPSGEPSADGADSERPSPSWFTQRVDTAVEALAASDAIADLILVGPNEPQGRTLLKGGPDEAEPFLRYIVARYGSYPNVWITLGNEMTAEMRGTAYPPEEVVALGRQLQDMLPYPTPLTVHVNAWERGLNSDPPWYTHMAPWSKETTIAAAADDVIEQRRRGARLPIVNDEQSYQGEGDGHSEEDNVAAHVGALVGGAYASGGEKPGWGRGQYRNGDFDADTHSAADNLAWVAGQVNEHVQFWRLRPLDDVDGVDGLEDSDRVLGQPGREYVIATGGARDLQIDLPAGQWTVRRLDAMAMTDEVVEEGASGSLQVATADSVAGLLHLARTSSP